MTIKRSCFTHSSDSLLPSQPGSLTVMFGNSQLEGFVFNPSLNVGNPSEMITLESHQRVRDPSCLGNYKSKSNMNIRERATQTIEASLNETKMKFLASAIQDSSKTNPPAKIKQHNLNSCLDDSLLRPITKKKPGDIPHSILSQNNRARPPEFFQHSNPESTELFLSSAESYKSNEKTYLNKRDERHLSRHIIEPKKTLVLDSDSETDSLSDFIVSSSSSSVDEFSPRICSSRPRKKCSTREKQRSEHKFSEKALIFHTNENSGKNDSGIVSKPTRTNKTLQNLSERISNGAIHQMEAVLTGFADSNQFSNLKHPNCKGKTSIETGDQRFHHQR